MPRVPTPIGKERAIVSTLTVDHWFDRFCDYLEEMNALSILEEPQRLFNCDESGFALGGKKATKVMGERGAKKIFEYKNSDKGKFVNPPWLCPWFTIKRRFIAEGASPME